MPRKTKPVDDAPSRETEKYENEKALDAVAGIAQQSSIKPIERAPLITTDTREKLLYKIARTGSPLGAEFFDQFTDTQEIIALAYSISLKLLVVAICDSDVSPAQRISGMRLIAALAGKQIPETEDEPAIRPLAPPSVNTSDEAMASIKKIQELQQRAS